MRSPSRQPHRTLGLLAPLLASAACASAPPPTPAAPAPTRAAPDALPDADWGEVRSARQLLALMLPDAARWTLDDSGPTWFVAQHPASGTRLHARTWRGPRSVSLAACHQEAALRLPGGFVEDSEAEVGRLALIAPEGFQGTVRVVAGPSPEGPEGRVWAVGRDVGRCFALSAVTRTAGAGAEQRLAARLYLLAERALGEVRLLGPADRGIPEAPRPARGARSHPGRWLGPGDGSPDPRRSETSGPTR